jgi:flagellar biosynthesis chaperone FliJ
MGTKRQHTDGSALNPHIVALEKEIKKQQGTLAKTIAREKKVRKKWARGYRAYKATVKKLLDFNSLTSVRARAMRERVLGWDTVSTSMTTERDTLRATMSNIQSTLGALTVNLTILREEQKNRTKQNDEIVTQVFALNALVVKASSDREECLKRHVFPRLIGADGKLCSQLSFTSSDGLRRVVAMVNTMTIVHADSASRAKGLIQTFFDRFREATEMDQTVKPLYELTRQLLVEKIAFKVGPDLYRFLAMDIDAVAFPELTEAQTLLHQSIRSEKTNSYIRIYQRDSRASKWEVVPQS